LTTRKKLTTQKRPDKKALLLAGHRVAQKCRCGVQWREEMVGTVVNAFCPRDLPQRKSDRAIETRALVIPLIKTADGDKET